MGRLRFAIDAVDFQRTCTNSVPSVQGPAVDVFAGCNACVTPFRNVRGEPCLDPSRHKDDMPMHYYTVVSGEPDLASIHPNYLFDPLLSSGRLDLANCFPFPPYPPGTDPNTLPVTNMGFHGERGPILFWATTGGNRFTTVYPDINCGYTANRAIGTDVLGSGNLGYGSTLRYFANRDEWDVAIELRSGVGAEQFVPTYTVADAVFKPHESKVIYEEPWQLAFVDGTPTKSGTLRVELHPWYNNNANDVLS